MPNADEMHEIVTKMYPLNIYVPPSSSEAPSLAKPLLEALCTAFTDSGSSISAIQHPKEFPRGASRVPFGDPRKRTRICETIM